MDRCGCRPVCGGYGAGGGNDDVIGDGLALERHGSTATRKHQQGEYHQKKYWHKSFHR
jgi:hypothetical protein